MTPLPSARLPTSSGRGSACGRAASIVRALPRRRRWRPALPSAQAALLRRRLPPEGTGCGGGEELSPPKPPPQGKLRLAAASASLAALGGDRRPKELLLPSGFLAGQEKGVGGSWEFCGPWIEAGRRVAAAG